MTHDRPSYGMMPFLAFCYVNGPMVNDSDNLLIVCLLTLIY